MTVEYDYRAGHQVTCDLCEAHFGPFHSDGGARRALRTHLLGDCPEMQHKDGDDHA